MSDNLLSVTSSEEFQKKVYESYSLKLLLRNKVKEILSGVGGLERIASCGTLLPWSSPILSFGVNGNPFFLTETCGSSSCPYCAAGKGAERLKYLEEGLNSFHRLYPFGIVGMMVLTLSHHYSDKLLVIGKSFREAKHLFFQQCTVKKILSSLGCIGRVSAPETTWSPLNGHHPHEHILFLLGSATDSDIKNARKELFPFWEQACRRVNIETSYDRFYFEKQITVYLKDYITKCAREVTLSDCKKGSSGSVSHYAPFQLVSAYMETGDSVFAEKYIEYAQYSKGLKSHNWSKGLAEALSVKQYSPNFSETQQDKKNALDKQIQIVFSGSDIPDLLKAKFISESYGDNQIQRLSHFMNYIVNSSFKSRIAFIRINNKDFTINDIYSAVKKGEF